MPLAAVTSVKVIAGTSRDLRSVALPGQTTLPGNLQLSAFDESGTIHREVQAKTTDSFIQLPRLIGSPGECFSVKVELEDFSTTEDFLI